VAERLAIRTRTTKWRERNPAAIADLRPRSGEHAKSSWAHELADGIQLAEVLGAVPLAPSLEIQALALFVLYHHHSSGNIPSVAGVSLLRSAIRGEVVEDSGSHLIPALDRSHRSLLFVSDEARGEALSHLFGDNETASPDGPRVLCWAYSVAQLLPLLKACLSAGAIRSPYDATAAGIQARYS
jgi:hypothetical protein